MRAKIRHFEKTARLLEPNAQQRALLAEETGRYCQSFLDQLGERPAYDPNPGKPDALLNMPIDDEPRALDELLDLFDEEIRKPGINPASGGHLGYIPGGGIFHAALGDYLADITNKYAGVYFASPGAVRLEHRLTNWMSELIGYPDTAAGDLTSGGSIANLMGIVAARDAYELKASKVKKAVIYLTGQAHHSVDKAVRIVGLNECVRRWIPVDERYRMRVDALESAIAHDRRSGLRPWLIIASAGTTDVGAVDPLEQLGECAVNNELWLHVDASYGGFFALCKDGEKVLQGMNRSDSIVMDPHKGLFLPYGSGAVLVRDGNALARSHYYDANYMQDANPGTDMLSPADLSLELSRPFRGLRLWLPLALVGLKPFRAALSEKLALARYFHDEIGKAPGFEVGPEPDLSVVTFRYVPKTGDANVFNKRLVEEIQKDGRLVITSTTLNGQFILRIAVLCFRTHLDTIDLALELLKSKAKKIAASL